MSVVTCRRNFMEIWSACKCVILPLKFKSWYTNWFENMTFVMQHHLTTPSTHHSCMFPIKLQEGMRTGLTYQYSDNSVQNTQSDTYTGSLWWFPGGHIHHHSYMGLTSRDLYNMTQEQKIISVKSRWHKLKLTFQDTCNTKWQNENAVNVLLKTSLMKSIITYTREIQCYCEIFM